MEKFIPYNTPYSLHRLFKLKDYHAGGTVVGKKGQHEAEADLCRRGEKSDAVMKRAIVIGSPGAGKSTFARKLKDKTGLPLYYLDRIFHKPARTTVTREEFDQKLQTILQTDRWIIDGNYQRTLPLRFEACTDVFFLDFPLNVCLEGAASRVGTVREDMPWVEQEFDPAFRQYILDFPKDQLPKIYELIERYRDRRRIMIFHSREEADQWIASEQQL